MKYSQEINKVEFVGERGILSTYSAPHCMWGEDKLVRLNTSISFAQIPFEQLDLAVPGAEFLSKRTWEQNGDFAFLTEEITFDPEHLEEFKLEVIASKKEEDDQNEK